MSVARSSPALSYCTGRDGENRGRRLAIAVGVVFLNLAEESLKKPYGNLVGAVVVVAVAREVALGLEVDGEARLVADDSDLRVLDRAD